MEAGEGPIGRVAVIGTGVIGASWAALFLARGLEVVATDPAAGAEARLTDYIRHAWPTLEEIGLAEAADPSRIAFVATPEEAVAGADFVQENGPERLDVKQDLYVRLDAATSPDVVIASSSSGLKPSDIQARCRRPERVLVGHPFNPPHLIPLVEVVGGERTSEAAIATAMAFYAGLGKHPIRIRKELIGHVANRLQVALFREAYHLVDIGAVTVAEVDAAISHGPGLRWALLGPVMLNHLSGGAGGLRHALDHLGPFKETTWADLGRPSLDEALKSKLVAGLDEALASLDYPAVVAARDRLIVELLKAKAESALP
ncbi:MAG: 3-hydroxyacyl-CoA dehydrogenase [Methylobacteriaceae bacterium]|nr:3-hydroxyacyl-CoA dehydrogenase [Methylobacteriaceae bacterium]